MIRCENFRLVGVPVTSSSNFPPGDRRSWQLLLCYHKACLLLLPPVSTAIYSTSTANKGYRCRLLNAYYGSSLVLVVLVDAGGTAQVQQAPMLLATEAWHC